MASLLQKIILTSFLFGSYVHAGQMGPAHQDSQGFFLGLGGNYNALNMNQNAEGLGLSNITVNSVLTSRGAARGKAAPFKSTSLNLSPEIQAGYLKSFNSDMFYGLKFTYQYLGLTTTIRDLYLPQTGLSTNVSTSNVNPMFGYAIADSVEITVDHDMNLFAMIGKMFGNKHFYLGAGPSLISIKSTNYNSIGYANIDGETLNVTGLVSYNTPTIWALGGAAQIGMSYFIDSSWFIDASYTYSIAGTRTSRYEQSFTNTSLAGSDTLDTSGILATKDTFKSTNLQSINLSINKIFDI